VHLGTEINRLVGVSCDGFEGQFLAILIAIEAKERHRQHGSAPRSEQGNKGSRKLRRLEYSISYDSKCKCSSCGKGRGLSIFSI
jgi:hypothetical protein